MTVESPNLVLVVRGGHHTCAIDLARVVEIMRPLAVQPVAGAPALVQGLSGIRGAPIPVVSLAGLIGLGDDSSTRWVVIRTGPRKVALAVEEVLGIRRLPESARSAMPPLLRDAAAGAIDAIGALDSELLFVLHSARVIPGELLASLVREERNGGV